MEWLKSSLENSHVKESPVALRVELLKVHSTSYHRFGFFYYSMPDDTCKSWRSSTTGSKMFAQIKAVLDVLIASVKVGRELKKETDRETFVVDVLSIYSLLKDTVEEGESLIVSAGSNPAAKLTSLPPVSASELVKAWDAGLNRQAERLYRLQGMIFAQDVLSVVAPEYQKSVAKAVGIKSSRVITLHGIGSSLVIRSMFGIKETPEKLPKWFVSYWGSKITG